MADIQSGFFNSGEGATYQLGNITLFFKTVSGAVQGDYSICETTSTTPGSGAGLHTHPYDEWHIVLKGNYEGTVGDEVRKLGPGDMLFAAGGTVHGLRNLGPGTARQLTVTSPARAFEDFIADLVNSQVDSGSPSRQGAPAFYEISAKHGVEFVKR